MELKITPEKVLDAAAKCSIAKETLQVLFPEVFKEKKEEFLGHWLTTLADFLNTTDYTAWEAIPGRYASDKAKWIINQIKNNK